ncbi:MAG TPA: hypothetical protein VGF79_15770 [Bacteroidia bacterium]
MKELEDSHLFPSVLRDGQTGFIGRFALLTGIYKPFIKLLKEQKFARAIMHDLCTGSGQPAIDIFNQSRKFEQLILSDKFPYEFESQDTKIRYLSTPVDVLNMQFEPDTCYTMFNAFHHFDDNDKLAITERIIKAGSEAYFVEILEPSPQTFFKVMLSTLTCPLLLTPFIGPFRLNTFIFTYLIPINLITIPFDGIVSVTKSLSHRRYKMLFAGFKEKVNVIRLTNIAGPSIVIKIQS